MPAYIGRRLIQVALILLGVAAITYLLLYMLPADPARMVAGRSATKDQVDLVRTQLGLDRPIWEQFAGYLWKLLQGDLGRSYLQRTQVTDLLAARLPASLLLMAGGIFCELVIGLTLGTIAALRRNSVLDQGLMITALMFISTPQYVVSLSLIYVFAYWLGWFPIGGYGEFKHLVLPAVALGLLGGGWYARVTRSSVIEVLRQDFIRTARAKGLDRWRIVSVHILPNAVLPIIAMVGIDIGYFMGSIVVVESVFGWPGIGQLTWQAIQQIDIPIIMGVTLLSACAIILGNLLADLVAPLIDPRIKLR
ncbi:MAG: glutathione ABC transporter permease GsiC [Rhodospirillum sp.]|jgi:peptide/nickel transport system permease protein|nr:glutathione ABC transporter permease GsiC [Rhodospirillum sp.]